MTAHIALTCPSCQTAQPRPLPYDMRAADKCDHCGVPFDRGHRGSDEQPSLAPTQQARDAAAKLFRHMGGTATGSEMIRLGEADSAPVAQAFAAFYAETVEQCAKAAEAFEDPSRDWLRRSVWDEIKRDTAARIRRLLVPGQARP